MGFLAIQDIDSLVPAGESIKAHSSDVPSTMEIRLSSTNDCMRR